MLLADLKHYTMQKTIKELKKGEVFTFDKDSTNLYIRGAYCRERKKYECTKYDDISISRYLPADKIVFID